MNRLSLSSVNWSANKLILQEGKLRETKIQGSRLEDSAWSLHMRNYKSNVIPFPLMSISWFSLWLKHVLMQRGTIKSFFFLLYKKFEFPRRPSVGDLCNSCLFTTVSSRHQVAFRSTKFHVRNCSNLPRYAYNRKWFHFTFSTLVINQFLQQYASFKISFKDYYIYKFGLVDISLVSILLNGKKLGFLTFYRSGKFTSEESGSTLNIWGRMCGGELVKLLILSFNSQICLKTLKMLK